MVRTHRGSIRALLQQAAHIQGPRDSIYPHNPKWKYRREQHARTLRVWIKNTREIIDAVEEWLDLHAPEPMRYKCIRCERGYMEEPDKCHDCSCRSFYSMVER